MTARTHLEPYPTLRSLSDADLCALTTRALCDTEIDGLQEVECSRCGEMFVYVRTGHKPQTQCPQCKIMINRERKHVRGPNDKRTHRPTSKVEFVRFVGINLNYRYGNWYRAEVVRYDIAQGLASVTDFDFEGARMEVVQ